MKTTIVTRVFKIGEPFTFDCARIHLGLLNEWFLGAVKINTVLARTGQGKEIKYSCQSMMNTPESEQHETSMSIYAVYDTYVFI